MPIGATHQQRPAGPPWSSRSVNAGQSAGVSGTIASSAEVNDDPTPQRQHSQAVDVKIRCHQRADETSFRNTTRLPAYGHGLARADCPVTGAQGALNGTLLRDTGRNRLLMRARIGPIQHDDD